MPPTRRSFLTQLAAAAKTASQSRAAIEATNIAREQTSQQKATLAETLAGVTAEKNALAARLAKGVTTTEQFNALNTRATALTAQVAALGAEKTALARQLENASDELAAATAARNAAQAQLAGLNAKATAAEKSAEQITALSADLAAARQQLAALTTEKSALQSQNTAGDAAATTALNAELVTLRQRLATAEATATVPAIAPAELAKLQGELSTARSSFEESQLKLEAALRSFTTLQKENEKLRQATESMVDAAKLETTLRSYALVQKENEELKAAAAETTAQQAKLPALQSELAELKSQVTALTDEKVALNVQLAAAAKPTAPAATPADDAGSAELRRQLEAAENKLAVALRGYTTLASAHDRLKAGAAERHEPAEVHLDVHGRERAGAHRRRDRLDTVLEGGATGVTDGFRFGGVVLRPRADQFCIEHAASFRLAV